MKNFLRSLVTAFIFFGLIGAAWLVVRPLAVTKTQTRGTIENLRKNDQTEKFSRAVRVRAFDFPKDHGAHDDFQTEWWYYTGNLKDKNGRAFGYQFTIFRRALSAMTDDERRTTDDEQRGSSFRFNQLYFAHFAVTDVARGEHVESEKYSRSALGLAGASASPFRVFIEDWSVEEIDNRNAEKVKLIARNEQYAIELELENTKPIVLHGEQGLSKKSPVEGNASYYYSMTRMKTSGRIVSPEGTFEVSGDSWLDREWSTSALDEQTAGWDWFSLQLDDNREIMFYRLRLKDGSSASVSKGTLVNADGSSVSLGRDDFQFTTDTTWRSSDSGAVYPIGWNVRLPRFDLALKVAPLIDNQEMNLTQRYWEGAVSIIGAANGERIMGAGYVELTGYGE